MVFRRVFRRDSPKIEFFEVFGFGVKNGGCEKCNCAWEFFVVGVGGGLHIIAGGFVVEKQGSDNDFFLVFDEVKGGKILF